MSGKELAAAEETERLSAVSQLDLGALGLLDHPRDESVFISSVPPPSHVGCFGEGDDRATIGCASYVTLLHACVESGKEGDSCSCCPCVPVAIQRKQLIGNACGTIAVVHAMANLCRHSDALAAEGLPQHASSSVERTDSTS